MRLFSKYLFGRAVFEAIEFKVRSRLNFEIFTSKCFSWLWKDCFQPRKCKADLCKTNGSKIRIYLSLLFFLKEAVLLQCKERYDLTKCCVLLVTIYLLTFRYALVNSVVRPYRIWRRCQRRALRPCQRLELSQSFSLRQVIWVVKFLREGYKVRSIFSQKRQFLEYFFSKMMPKFLTSRTMSIH